MRLLQKREVDTLKTQEFRRTQEEGLKLARRVDALRQILPQEEATLEKWRVDTISKIHEEIKAETAKLDDLTREVKELESRRLAAIKPINEELAVLEAKRTGIERQDREVTAAAKDVEAKANEVAQSREIAALELKKAFEERRRATEFLEESDMIAHESRLMLAENETIRDRLFKMREQVEKELQIRDIHMASKEKSLTMWEDTLKAREKELDIERLKLIDQRATLERALARIKK